MFALYFVLSYFSVHTRNSHEQGVKHVKKKIAMEAKHDQLRNQGLAPETKVVRQVIQVYTLNRHYVVTILNKTVIIRVVK